jgi:transposase
MLYDRKMTNKPDTRNLPPEAQQQMRVQIIKLRRSGMTNRETARKVGVSERHASVVWQRFQNEGATSLQINKRGRRKGQHEKLGAKQWEKMLELMFLKPSDAGIIGEIWTRCRVQQTINQHLKINVSIRTIGGRLNLWGMIPYKPINLEDNIVSSQINKWANTEYRKILKRVEQEKGELHWFVEQMVGYREQDPISTVCLQPFTMLATIAKQGQIRFMLTRDEITSKIFREFLTRLIKDVDKKVFLLMKRITSLYLNKTTGAWLDEHKEKIEVVYLPI